MCQKLKNVELAQKKKKRQIEKEKRLRAELKAINEKIAFSDKFSKKHAKN